MAKPGGVNSDIPELEYLQQIVISDNHFIEPGLRTEGGFVGEHDRTTGMPMPDHISARPDDLSALMTGLIETCELLSRNETIDLYRYFDATKQAEFFFECVEETVNKTLPDEIEYLKKYDSLNEFIKNYIDMPDKLVDLLIRFLAQNGGKLSKRGREREFKKLTAAEIQAIENKYAEILP